MARTGTTPRGGLARWALVVVAALLIVWRAPQYLVAPSFWAEDGMFFFAGAWNAGPLRGLVQRPAGYLVLYANVATSLAALLVQAGVISLATAPRVTAVAALLAQLVPVVLLAFARAPAWGGWWRRAGAIAIVLFGARTGGMWLNTVNSQYFLALAAIIVLLEPAGVGRVRRWVYAAIVALATLAGPVASFVTPLFLLKAWRTRARSVMLLAAVSSVCSGIQLGVIALGGIGAASPRAQGLSAPVLAMLAWTRTVVLPVLGRDAALAFTNRLGPTLALMGTPLVVSAPVFSGLMLGTLALVVAILALGAPREVRWWLAGSYALVTVGSYVGAVGDLRGLLRSFEGAARYFFVPSVLILWLLLLNVRPDRRVQSLVCGALLAVGLGISAWSWRETVRWQATWPVWADEVAAWERDPRTPLHIWPAGWTMRLFARRTP